MASFLVSFKGIFSGKHKGMTLGIDIGSSSIKIVLLEKVNEKSVLRNYGEISLGPRAGFSVGQATNLPPEKVAEALSDLLKETGIIAKHTFIAIPFSASLLSVVELPQVGKNELEPMIMNEARRYIPIPMSEVSLDWWVLPKRKDAENQIFSASSRGEGDQKQIGKIEVIIAAIHNEVITKYESIKKSAHIPGEASHFEIELFSTLRAVVGRDLSPILVIDIGAGSTKVAIIEEGVVRGAHVISMGGQDLTMALSHSQGVSFEKAEEMKCRVGIVGEEEGRDILVVSEIILSTIMNETGHFSENYEHKHGTKITKIILVGGGARLKGIEKIILQNFPKASVIVGDPFSRVETPAFLDSTLKEISSSFGVSLGVALKGLEE